MRLRRNYPFYQIALMCALALGRFENRRYHLRLCVFDSTLSTRTDDTQRTGRWWNRIASHGDEAEAASGRLAGQLDEAGQRGVEQATDVARKSIELASAIDYVRQLEHFHCVRRSPPGGR